LWIPHSVAIDGRVWGLEDCNLQVRQFPSSHVSVFTRAGQKGFSRWVESEPLNAFVERIRRFFTKG